MREATVAEGACGAVDEGYAWVGEVGSRELVGFGQVEDAADGAVATAFSLVSTWHQLEEAVSGKTKLTDILDEPRRPPQKDSS